MTDGKGTCTCQERPVAFADGNVEGLATHLAKKYGGEHPFSECMDAEELGSYDEETRKQICGRVKALQGGGDKKGTPIDLGAQSARMGERLDFIIREENGSYCLYSHEGKLLGKHKSKAEAMAQENAINMAKAGKYSNDGSQKDGTMTFAAPDGGNELTMEVFATGEWAGLPWVENDLDQMVDNFKALYPKGIKPPVKVGHGDTQILAQSHEGKPDGQPALGWVKDLERRGDKLVAKVSNVPTVIREAIDKGLYSRLSAEIYPKFEMTGAERNIKSGVKGKVISAISILGAQVPEVKSLEDLGKLLAAEDGEPILLTESPCADGAIACYSACERPVPVKSEGVRPLVAGNLNRVSLKETVYPPTTKTADNTRQNARHSSETKDMSEVTVEIKPETVTTPAADVSADLAALRAEFAAYKAQAEASAKTMASKVELAEREREAAKAYAVNQEARRFVEERTTKENRKLTQAQTPYVIRLYESLGADDALITAEEATELKLFTEGKEKPRALTARDCLARLIDSWPNMKVLASEMSEATDPRPETFEEAFTKVIVREKLDPKTITYAERQRVARLVLQENPSLKPKYGNGFSN